jgi:hypothetical protein
MTTKKDKEAVQTDLPIEVVDETTASIEVVEQSWEDVIKAKALEQAQQKAMLASGPKFVSFKGGQLTIDKVPIPKSALKVVVLTFIAENTYYKGKFDPTKTQMPLCYAVYRGPDEMWPNADDVKEAQADTCQECIHYQWGSDPMGGRGKACKTRYRIAMIPAPDENSTVADILGSELRFATIPVTSCKNFEQYVSRCELLYSRPMFGVIGELSVEPNEKTLYEVKLTAISAIHGPLLIPMMKRIEEAEKAITYDYSMDEDYADQAKPLKQ